MNLFPPSFPLTLNPSSPSLDYMPCSFCPPLLHSSVTFPNLFVGCIFSTSSLSITLSHTYTQANSISHFLSPTSTRLPLFPLFLLSFIHLSFPGPLLHFHCLFFPLPSLLLLYYIPPPFLFFILISPISLPFQYSQEHVSIMPRGAKGYRCPMMKSQSKCPS